MKKYLLVILLCIILYPSATNAKEYCKVVSNNGELVGSEVVCGTEHFNIMEVNDSGIRMLAKYNLLVGSRIEREEFNGNSSSQACYSYAMSKGGVYKNSGPYVNVDGYCFVEYPITGEILQSETAISAHWDEDNNYLYPQIGDNYIDTYNSTSSSSTISNHMEFTLIEGSGEKYNNYYYDLNVGNGNISNILNQYKTNLENMNYTISNIDLITLDEVNTLVKRSNHLIPYEEWYNHTPNTQPPFFEFGWLNDLVTNNEKFIYNSTYWIRTGYDLYSGDRYTSSFDYQGVNSAIFINSRGGVCSAHITYETGLISSCYPYMKATSDLGAGIRPIITIPANELQYQIKADSNGNGEIEVISSSLGNKEITFKIKSNNGIKLLGITVITDSGTELEFTGDDLVMQSDGTYKISNNKFTMPFENVTIKARWDINNPATLNTFLILLVAMLMYVLTAIIYYIRKKSLQ